MKYLYRICSTLAALALAGCVPKDGPTPNISSADFTVTNRRIGIAKAVLALHRGPLESGQISEPWDVGFRGEYKWFGITGEGYCVRAKGINPISNTNLSTIDAKDLYVIHVTNDKGRTTIKVTALKFGEKCPERRYEPFPELEKISREIGHKHDLPKS